MSDHPPHGPTIIDSTSTNTELFEIIDRLRALGLDLQIDLPRLAVFGDQSCGKSSVLEAITGVKLPSNDVLCTRLAIEIIVRSSSPSSWHAEIVPGRECTDADRELFATFNQLVHSKVQSPQEEMKIIVEEAEKMTRVGQQGAAFTDSFLRLQMVGQGLLDLDVVDTPGLFHSKGEGQSEADIPIVRELAESYMKRPSTIIIAVLSAGQDIAGQQVMQLAHQHDPEAQRTLGVCTKPDKLDGENLSQQFLRLLQNKITPLQLGWHVLKNRAWNQQDLDRDARDAAEASFFTTGIWPALPDKDKGIAALNLKLIAVYRQHMISLYPRLRQDVLNTIRALEDELGQLPVVQAPDDPQKELYRIAIDIASAIRQAITGKTDNIQGQVSAEEAQLRSRCETLIRDFKQSMRSNGHRYDLVPDRAANSTAETGGPVVVTYDEMANRIKSQISSAQLAAQLDRRLTTELFLEQAGTWEAYIDTFVDDLKSILEQCLLAMLHRLCPSKVAETLIDEVVAPAVQHIMDEMREAVKQQLPQRGRGDIQFADDVVSQAVKSAEVHYMTKVFLQLRAQSSRHGSLAAADSRNSALESLTISPPVFSGLSDRDALQMSLEHHIDVLEITAHKTIECMQLHYQAELDRFLSWFTLVTIDRLVFEKLQSFVTVESLQNIDEDHNKTMFSVDDSSQKRRAELVSLVDSLQTVLKDLKRWMEKNMASATAKELKRKRRP